MQKINSIIINAFKFTYNFTNKAIFNNNNIYSKSSFLNIQKNLFVEKTILENKIKSKINCENLEVVDISGNCGTSFCVKIKSPDFKGKTMIMQHRMVNEALKDEIKDIHALQIKSEASK